MEISPSREFVSFRLCQNAGCLNINCAGVMNLSKVFKNFQTKLYTNNRVTISKLKFYSESYRKLLRTSSVGGKISSFL